MGAKDQCKSKEEGCPTFSIKQVEYNGNICDLTNNFTGIKFEFEGSDAYPDVEQYRLLLKATTNTKFIKFSADSSGANPSPHKIELIDVIDPSTTTTITLYVSKIVNANSPSREVTIDCKFWHGETVDSHPDCHHSVSIVLCL